MWRGIGCERERGKRESRAGEAMRRKSTAHQGEIEMMEGPQLRHRDRGIQTVMEEGRGRDRGRQKAGAFHHFLLLELMTW